MASVRCWMGWPPGHLYESVVYRDPMSGRWRAFARCLRCARTRSLRIGERRRKANFPGNPLATFMAFASRPAESRSPIEHVEPDGAMVVEVPETGELLELRAALVAWGPWRGDTVFCARLLGDQRRRAASRDLRAAVAEAAGARPRTPWVDDLARQLEHELTP